MQNAKPKRDAPGVLAPPPVIFAAGWALGWGLDWLVPVRVFDGWPFKLAGWLVAVVAGLLAVWGAWTMHRAGTHIDPYRSAAKVVTWGPFHYTRNPLYLSLALLAAGAALYLDVPWALVTLVPTVGVMQRYVIRREERYLEGKFGEEYAAYKRRTRRWA